MKDMQDIEFTVEDRVLYLLQTRPGKRTVYAAWKSPLISAMKVSLINRQAVQRIKEAD